MIKARLHDFFDYNPETGDLIFKIRDKSEFSTEMSYGKNLKKAGKVASARNSDGYIKIHVDGHYFSAHRAIWLMVYGEEISFPEFEIDHINGVRDDNRLCNLRKVTKSENQRNSSSRTNNTSGVHGVNRKPRPNKKSYVWVARIWNGPKHVYLGQYDTLHEAAIARRAAEMVLGYTGMDRSPSAGAIRRAERKRLKAEQLTSPIS